ncbi:MAG TPA: sigma-70 family RNA polymerase sigma factor [Candidatus Eisenbacteria bacterium]|nr:sigma-70 family RNA polymerase sigma factor [Candidatus Eisenbacteria bacterium]
MEKTAVLLSRIAQGDARAQSELERRLSPKLSRYAHGRLPAYARGMETTSDLVSDALRKSFAAIGHFDLRHEGAFLGYARKALNTGIVDAIRRANARPKGDEIDENLPSRELSPIDTYAGREFRRRFDEALELLTPEQHQAVVLRLELGYSFADVAEAMESPSTDAARMLVNRAIERLAHELRPFASDL